MAVCSIKRMRAMSRLFLMMFLGLFLCMNIANAAFNLTTARKDTTMLCIEEEKQALLMFKQGLIDDYGRLSSWRNNTDCCRWEDVYCNNATGHVTELDISGLGLRGKINPSLLQLRYLNYLYLSYNDFGGSQFPELINGSMNELRELTVARTGLSPKIINLVRNLSRLELLDLSFCFYKIPNFDWLHHLSSLKHLDLSGNPLGENNWLTLRLPNHLETLELRACGLHGIISPPLNTSFVNLSVIDLSDNSLTSSSTYKFLGNICGLRTLDLSYNNLTGRFPKLPKCMVKSLEQFMLLENRLHGPLPDIRGYSSLKTLFISNNQLNGSLSESFSALPSNLTELSLDSNQLTGSLPDFCNASISLLWLDIANNRLNGTLTKSFGCLSRLVHFYASRNSLEGVISETHFDTLSKLESLDLSFNHLSFNISIHWVAPFHLKELFLSDCKLGPYFPKWIETQTDLEYLDISGAGISDTIPDWFWDMSPNLYLLNVSHNNITGIISGSLPNAHIIDLSSNLFGGPLPLFASSVYRLYLARNMFTVSLYPLCKFTNKILADLDVSNNLLSGVLSECLFGWKDLVVLNLANNNFSGEIPRSMGSLFSLKSLNLHNNSFSGNLPSSLKNCSKLSFLDLSNNRLSGNIPSWIGEKLSSLELLSLKANEIGGRIPVNLCQLANMKILDLSENNINGTVPWCLNNLTSMSRKPDLGSIIERRISIQYQAIGDIWFFHGWSSYFEKAWVEWKGKTYEYDKFLGLFRIINLGSNKLTGEIPTVITSLSELVVLNLSRNYLSGPLPQNMSQWKHMESLDLSRNQLFGEIPTSMVDLNFLGYLDLSYNNLSGRIPSGTQLQSFNVSAYIGNQALCGPPITKQCPEDDMPQDEPAAKHENEDEFSKWFYTGMGLGFSVGFWGICSALLLKRSWRHAYFQFLDKVQNSLYVTFTLLVARLQRKLKN